jgi:hypothetical protein
MVLLTREALKVVTKWPIENLKLIFRDTKTTK